MICRKCETEMVLGIATAQTYVGGPGEVIECWKCPDCGRSVEKGEDDGQ